MYHMNIVLFYDSQDRPTAHRLLEMLRPDIEEGQVKVSTPEHLNTGKPLDEETDKLLADCCVFVLFISAQLFSLPAYQLIEPILVKRHKANQIKFFPILTRHCLWESSGIAALNEYRVPNDGWLSEYSDKDQMAYMQQIADYVSGLDAAYIQLVDEARIHIEILREKLTVDLPASSQFENRLKILEKMEGSGTNSPSELFIYRYQLVADLNHFSRKIRKSQSRNTESALDYILYLYANPNNMAAALFDREQKEINSVLESHRTITFHPRAQVEAFELLKELTMNPARIVHISVHGSRHGELLFVDDSNDADGVTADRLYRIFEQLKTKDLLPELLLINACHSKGHAEKLAELVPFTIGMEGTIPVSAAVKFAEIFYLNHLAGADIRFSFDEAVLAIQKLNIADQRGIKVHEMPHFYNQKN